MTRPLRLLTIGHSYSVDVNRRLAHAIQRASAGRWNVTVGAPTYFAGRNDIRPSILKLNPDEPCEVRPIPTLFTRQVHTFFYRNPIRSLLQEGWDLVHAWEEPFILAGWQISRHVPATTPFVFRTAQSLPKRYPLPFRRFENSTVQRAVGWICSGQKVETNLLARPHYADRPHAIIPLGVDTETFRPDSAARAAILQQLGWADDGVPVIGYLGRFVPEKGIAMLLRVLDRLTIPWRAVFLGGGPLEKMITSWSEKHSDRVRILTMVAHNEVPNYMSAFDVLTMPSQTTFRWAEQFGRAIVEAFAAGVPVIASDSGEIPNVLRGSGMILPESDETAWLNGVTDLLGDPARRHKMAEEGRERSLQEFDWSVVGGKHIEFFDSLLASRK
ncbi:glycosyltransferase family 4 protein [soil metagenome]